MLQNNSSQMNTIVETFIIEETAELIYDNEKLEQWNKHVHELGLEGQTHIITKDKSPIPFMHLKTSMVNVFKTLCPSHVDVSKYNLTPIPVEILDLVALATREKHFSKIQIWFDEKDPDPCCIGISGTWYAQDEKGQKINGLLPFKSKKEGEDYMQQNSIAGSMYDYSWEAIHYLIGKWGDVKRSFDELKKMASNRYFIQQTNIYNDQINHYKRELEDLKSKTFKMFEANNVAIQLDDLPF